MTTPIKLLIILCGILAVGFVCVSGTQRISSTDDFKQLSLWERIGLFTAAKVNPKMFENVPLDGLFVGPDNPTVDSMFVDLRSMLIHAWNFKEDQDLFEVDWHYDYEVCIFGCFYLWFHETSSETRILGLKDMVTSTEITPTTVTNSYYIPFFQWSSPNYLWNITFGYTTGLSHMFHGFDFTMEEVNTTFVFDYFYVPELGFQVDKLDIDFSVGRMETLMHNWTEIDHFDGQWLEHGPMLTDYAEYIVPAWLDYYKVDYLPHLKDSINCVLSGGRVDPIGCANQTNTYYDTVRYYQMNVVQLFETFALAAFNRPEASSSE